MEVKQVAELVNAAAKEVLGETALVNEDLSNVVSIGNDIEAIDGWYSYIKALFNRIGKTLIIDRVYGGDLPKVYMDGWEYGSVEARIQIDMPKAEENESWELEHGHSYDPNIYYKPSVTAQYNNKRVAFEVPFSITTKQLKQSFASATELNAFVSALYTAAENAMTVRLGSLIRATISNMIGETLYAEIPGGGYGDTTTVKAVNLLNEYNTLFPDSPLTTADALTSADFLKFASNRMGLYLRRMREISTLYNIAGKERFTPESMQHVILLADFEAATAAYLESDTFHNELVKLPNHDTVPFWQGTGTGYDFDDVSSIDIKTASGHTITATGILGVMFDHYALGVTCMDRRTTSQVNNKAEFVNNWAKMDAGYFNDPGQNFVVFYIADATA